ncbi:MAG: hypothetical protein GXO64_04760 [Candidatus Micrarchaeota archaeon]|nr:hypothetical protein [Candidatus Micrarchaeota archaeon]
MVRQQRRKSKRGIGQAQAAKKWKGKDWFNIISPAFLGSKVLYQTPSTDPASLIGRNVSAPLSIVTGERGKYFMWLRFRIADVEGTNAKTIVSGLHCMNEYISRVVRKRRDKVELTHVTKTKDGWTIRIKPLIIMTRNVSSSVRTTTRKGITEIIDEKAKKFTMEELTKEIISGSLQSEMRKRLSKTYPVRFAEISKIKVLEAAIEKQDKGLAAEKPEDANGKQ